MPATLARGSMLWLVTSFLSNGCQLQFPHGGSMVPQENQTACTRLNLFPAAKTLTLPAPGPLSAGDRIH
jgi:hypothetical protein